MVQLLRDRGDEVTPPTRVEPLEEDDAPHDAQRDAAVAPRGASPGALHSALVGPGNFFFRFRNALFPVAFVAIAAATRPLAPFGSERADRWMDAAGVLVALAGQTLRALVIGLAYIRRGGKDQKIYAETLVTEGFFAHSRNPLYLGNMLVFLGLFLILNSTWGYAIGVPFFLFAYLSIVSAEENYLLAQFGAPYRDYCRRVNRFFPSLAGLGETIRGMAFNWKRLIRKEYGSTFTWLTTALALVAWENVARRGADAAAPVLRSVLIAWAPVVLGYGLARFLKKTHRLESG